VRSWCMFVKYLRMIWPHARTLSSELRICCVVSHPRVLSYNECLSQTAPVFRLHESTILLTLRITSTKLVVTRYRQL
jgi:hypothetical protein